MQRSLTGRRYDPDEPEFPFVYVNQDGTVRELSPAERDYLSMEFDPTDGGRPYVKATYESRDGWGSMSGYLARAAVPSRVGIAPVHSEYDARVKALREDWLDADRAAGDVIVHNADGTITVSPNRPPRARNGSSASGVIGSRRRGAARSWAEPDAPRRRRQPDPATAAL